MVLPSVMENGGKSPALKRFSSLEPRTPSTPHSPADSYHIYTLHDDDDNVFGEDGDGKANPLASSSTTTTTTTTKGNNNNNNNNRNSSTSSSSESNIVPPPPTPGTAPALGGCAHRGWSRKRLRTRDALLIAVVVVLFVGVAVGVSLAVVLVDSSSSESSSSSSSTSSTTPIPSPEVRFLGHLTLTEPWQGSISNLARVFTADMGTLTESTAVQKALIKSSFVSLSANMSVVHFSLNFARDQLHTALSLQADDVSAPDDDVSAGRAVQALLRNQVVKRQAEMTLSIRPESIVILENIPVTPSTPVTTTESSTTISSSPPSSSSSPTSTTTEADTTTTTAATSPSSTTTATTSPSPTTATTTSPSSTTAKTTTAATNPSTSTTATTTTATTATTLSPTSTSVSTTETTDAPTNPSTTSTLPTPPPARCEVMTFEPCGSVVGNSHFYLPNLLGHTSPDDAQKEFENLLGPSGATRCSDHVFRFACSLLFPPCDDVDTSSSNSPLPVPRHPCRSFCDDVKNDCGSFPNFPQNCDEFPTTDCTGPLILTTPRAETTTAITTTEATTTTSVATKSTSTTEFPDYPDLYCVNFELPVCKQLGFDVTSLPSVYEGCEDDIPCLISLFEFFANDSIHSGCMQDMTFFCLYTFPGCNVDYYNEPIWPCREACEDAVQKCGRYMPYPPDCLYLPAQDDPYYPCIPAQPEPSTTTPTPTPIPDVCIDQNYGYCAEEGFTRTYEKTWFADTLVKGVQVFETWAQPTIDSGCSALAKFFYCGIFFPKCEEGQDVGLPCRKYCEEISAQCPNATFPMDCTVFDNNDTCVHPMTSTTPAAVTTTAAPPTTTEAKIECQPLDFSICKHFGYSQTSFPNFWGDMTSQAANKTYYSYAEVSVSAGCSPNIVFYVCSMLFPYCEGPDAKHKLPCKSVCEEVNQNCPLLFVQNCTNLSDPNPDTCLAPPERYGCKDTEFSCANIDKCIPVDWLCDKKNDCGDWSDERDCNCHPDFEVKCDMGLCINSYERCDGKVQCPDNSDEAGCKKLCPKGQYKCNGTELCIMREWLCDGQVDCPDHQDDELFCHWCEIDEFTCVSTKECIPLGKVCDGTPQCSDHTDERDCIFKNNPGSPFFLNVWKPKYDEYSGSLYDSVPVCARGFNNIVGQTSCMKMGEDSLERWEEVETFFYYLFFELDPNGTQMSAIGRGNLVQNCQGPLAAVTCRLRECGHPAENLPNSIINGLDALPGAWPWMVSFQQYGVHKCGGAIISPYFVLTAGHCVDSYMSFDSLMVIAGTTHLSRLGQTGRRHYIRRVILHPGFVFGKANDIALLELKTPLEYSDYIKPLCFPEEDDVFTMANECHIAGWGHLQGNGGAPSRNLQQTKLSLWDTNKCNSSFMWDGLIKEDEICAGYYNGLIAPCYGDSGSAVACKDEFGTWKSVGVASYVFQTCNVASKPSVFAATLPYLDWIKNQTVCQFTCDNGVCLFDKSMLCNAIDDCGDKSDEINLCDISANCSFTDYFLCGYQTKLKWKLVTHGNSKDAANRFPLFDHTKGGAPGKFLMGPTRGVDIYTPRIDLTKPHCMRFHYHMRGEVQQGMRVSAHKIQLLVWVGKWIVEETIGPDRWLMGTFDLEPGHWDIVFRPHDDQRFSLDDMYLLEGTCDEMKCLPGEFMCNTFGSRNCLPVAVRCNMVLDCDDGQDEENCSASLYTCDFENGNLCGLQQSTTDSVAGEWVMADSSDTPRNLVDHTFANDSGTMLKIPTAYMLREDKVHMFQDVLLEDTPYCLKLFYASTSPATLQVKMEWDNKARQVLRFTDRLTPTWIPVQATLPTLGQSTKVRLSYYVIGGELGFEIDEQAILIDDITISRGACSEFTCPPNTLKCGGEAYCLPMAKVCDRVVHCLERTDEINCACEADEYKCPTGSCIPREKTCDLIRDCPDGSDEGSVCDPQRSISCDFENKFLCGYTVNTTSNGFHWARHSGPTPRSGTGPNEDHTFEGIAGLTGHYIFADGLKEGDYTSLESFPFLSDGKGLAFFYHARHFLRKFWMTGRLSLIVTQWSTGEQTEVWAEVPSDEDTWRSHCVTLPPGNISISFVVQRGSGYRADIALDDILKLTESCDQFLLGGRIIGPVFGASTSTEASSGSGVCKADESPCNNNMCLKKTMFCDKVSDCPDGFDEVGCDEN
ncbi:uncharacterized protein LOC101863910 [Aplysia californica]|uniref:Uncharacterized protein LOC101863910 n=1 Tax=Aplysia californica TaxID=6500 RepID=A0ABM0JTY1_APLCA|nr:uncharacterized protein LOC101863910 [Aplysia californica]